MVDRRIALTNPVYRFAPVLLLLVACSARESSVITNPDASSVATVAAGVWVPPPPQLASASAAAPAPVVVQVPPSDEPLIREFQDLARKPGTKSELEAFVTAHPRLLQASAHPYGPTIMWMLEFTDEQAALVLYAAGADIPKSALALAARGGLDAFVDLLLAKGADPNWSDEWGNAPLHQAAKYGHVTTVRKLLAAKAAPSPQIANDGFTPLHIAVMERKEEVISVLIAAHADIEARDHHGQTPLHWGPFAYRAQSVHIYHDIGEPHDTVFRDPGPAKGIQLLLNAGAKIDAIDDEGNTPLHEAALLNSVRGAEALLARGAKVNVKNKAGETPLSIAKAAAHRASVLKVLLRAK